MNDLSIFHFEELPVRITDRDGGLWFVLSDVCQVLEINNSRQAASRLDDDQKGVISSDTLGGQQEMTIVNESGLYNLIFRSRKAAAKRFRRWVTNEVLPSIRKTGRYEAPGAKSKGFNPGSIPELNSKVSLVAEARQAFGPAAARECWEALGLPKISNDMSTPDTDPAYEDPHGCLAHLMRHRGRRGTRIGEMIELALTGDAERETLPGFGLDIVCRPGDEYPEYFLVIARKNLFLRHVFEFTQWCNAWHLALGRLPDVAEETQCGDIGRGVLIPFRVLREHGHFKGRYGALPVRKTEQAF